jgi:hypothetical protein
MTIARFEVTIGTGELYILLCITLYWTGYSVPATFNDEYLPTFNRPNVRYRHERQGS